MISMSNTKEKGNVEQVVFYNSNDKCWVGVCLTFNLLVEGATEEEATLKIKKLSLDYISFIRENNLSDNLLNRPAPSEYWDIYKSVKSHSENTLNKNEEKLIVEMQPSLTTTPYFPTLTKV